MCHRLSKGDLILGFTDQSSNVLATPFCTGTIVRAGRFESKILSVSRWCGGGDSDPNLPVHISSFVGPPVPNGLPSRLRIVGRFS